MVVGGKDSVYSPLDPPEAAQLIKLETENRRRSSIESLYNENTGGRYTYTHKDLNIAFNKSSKPLNGKYWPLSAVVREITANMIDAGLEATNGVIEKPVFKTANSLSPVSGYHALNGELVGSYTLAITEVFKNSKVAEDKDDAKIAPVYIENKTPECEEESTEEEDRTFRVALYIRSVSAMPISAWVTQHTEKNKKKTDNPVLRENLIGGFGVGLKDACIHAMYKGMDQLQFFVHEPKEADVMYRFCRTGRQGEVSVLTGQQQRQTPRFHPSNRLKHVA